MTAHIPAAAVYIQLTRGRSAAARTLFARAIDFETAFRVLVHIALDHLEHDTYPLCGKRHSKRLEHVDIYV